MLQTLLWILFALCLQVLCHLLLHLRRRTRLTLHHLLRPMNPGLYPCSLNPLSRLHPLAQRQFLHQLIEEGRLKVDAKTTYKGKKITFHDPCYLGRANKEYEAPRALIEKLSAELVEMKSCKEKGLCCGAGGAQMFKDAEKGDKEVNIKRTEQALDTKPEIIAAGCPFCNTMLHDGVKNKGKEGKVAVLDVAQLLAQTESL